MSKTAAFILGGIGLPLLLVFLGYKCLKTRPGRVPETAPPHLEAILTGGTSPHSGPEDTTIEEVWGDLSNHWTLAVS